MPRVIATIPPAGLVESLLGRAVRLLAQLRGHRSRARTRKILRGLSDAQLADAAIDPTAVLPPQPVIEVEARLMARLMEMR